MSDQNLHTYNSSSVINWYKTIETIVPVEKLIFETLKDKLTAGKVLDIGIGAGRTTSYLVGKCKQYTGIDYSENFVSAAKLVYPKTDLRCMDARNLKAFADNSFDFINFSFNGIDYVDLAGRKQIFAEVNRILKPNGTFFFSTHSKNHRTFNKAPWLNKENSTLINLKTFIKLVPFFPKHLEKKKEEIHSTDYAIINDSAHNYNLMTFYTSPEFLRKQLLDFKFTAIDFYHKDGRKAYEDFDEWIFVSCQKLFA